MDDILKAFIKHTLVKSKNELGDLLDLIVSTLLFETGEGSLLNELELLYASDEMNASLDAAFSRLKWLCEYFSSKYSTLIDAIEDEEDV